MQDTFGIVKIGLFLALSGLGACLLVTRLVRIGIHLVRLERDLLKVEEELKRTQERLRNRLRS